MRRSIAVALEALLVRRPAVCADQALLTRDEDVLDFDDVALDTAGNAHDLAHPTASVVLCRNMHDDVDAGRHSWDHEGVAYVFSGEKRQGAELRHRFPRTVRVYRRHAGNTRVERDEQVQAFFLPDLTNNYARRPHAQRFFDEAPQPDLARALETRLAGLHRDPVGQRGLELEDLLARDDALVSRN